MITARAWAGKRYGVLGLARSGAATVRALLASGASVVAWDADEGRRVSILPELARGGGPSRSDGGGASTADDKLRPLPLHHSPAASGPPPRDELGEDESLVIADLSTIDLTTLDALVVSPGVPLNTHPLAAKARAAGVAIIGDIELFAQARSGLPPHKVVGITGTNGKSTTTALIHHILKTAGVPSLMGGNIGLPILAQEPLPAGGVYVLELSSYQIDLTHSLDCDVAVLTNITPDHLDRYDGFEAYAASKVRLLEMQSPGHVAIVGFSEETRTTREADVWWIFDGTPLSEQADWPALQGLHNGMNAQIAMAAARMIEVVPDAVKQALRTFPGLPHRMERIAEVAGVAYVNDSKATNPESAAPALAAFPRVHWIVGGRAKGDDLDACRPGFPHVARAYTIGEAGPRFAAVLAPELPVTECGTLDVAVHAAAAAAQPGETVLLSPAAASFDQYRDFEARGDAFRALVVAVEDGGLAA
ncbi:UDP-N-acetylmuramoyl-L-alanine--D-glutamate ligase [uncultured Sphingomonas sp.]|uniref:UDP-N-acetylmuramoyl-L-alanine--D-glutamate ligase n=1 Tax=uncultured Sphingomonas sp. TaxID=158754 RepID=UPI0035CAB2F9